MPCVPMPKVLLPLALIGFLPWAAPPAAALVGTDQVVRITGDAGLRFFDAASVAVDRSSRAVPYGALAGLTKNALLVSAL
jgi:hypothetical protein